MPDLPTLVFVPGSWHRPTCYDKLIKILQEKHGLECISFTLPSTTGDPEATFKDDIDAARTAISSQTTRGRDVIVIAHSYGGMVGNSAIKGFTRSHLDNTNSSSPAKPPTSNEQTGLSQHQTPATGHVIGLVLIASGFTLTGLAFMDPLFGIPPPSWRVNKETGFAELVAPPRQLFYHDLPVDEADECVSQLTPHSLKSLFEGGEHAYAGWKDVPSWYIGTIEDQGLPVLMQRMQVGMAREMGGVVEHRELQTSHSPFLSQPNTVADILVEATAAFTGKVAGREQPQKERRTEILAPAARMLEPYSWFRFGLPLAFGHVIGRCVILFTSFRGLWRA